MGDVEVPHTCLSDDDHHGKIRHYTSHYFGCLREEGRHAYLTELESSDKTKFNGIHERASQIKQLKARVRRNRTDAAKYMDEIVALSKLFREKKSDRQPDCQLRSSTFTAFDLLDKQLLVDPDFEAGPDATTGYGMETSMLFFKDLKPWDHPAFPKTFPNQKIKIHDLLENNPKNPLIEPCEPDMIRYFHLPHNNMSWVEKVIARHYNEENPKYNSIYLKPDAGSKTQMVLRPELWRGQQHGSQDDAIHARYMRPHCERICIDQDSIQAPQDNLVLFMPYLHWETDRQRSEFAKIIQQTREQKALKDRTEAENARVKRIRARSATKEIKNLVDTQRTKSEGIPTLKAKRFFVTTSIVSVDRFFELRRHQILAQILLRAAKLFEVMAWFDVEEMIKENLYANPPLHPRRTLDQFWYWPLPSTEARDRDQVVFRGTSPVKKDVHHPACSGSKCWYHMDCKLNFGCPQCSEDVRKRPSVVMVDQLWLWILDGNTIITSFPRRWARYNWDPSGVHKSLRVRLKGLRQGEIRSVYDLALIIIDQCSKVFFSRSLTADRQPPVMDIFANAIGDVNVRQSAAYEKFWRLARDFSLEEKGKKRDIAKLERQVLDINEEGQLLKEISDIKDELHIMKHVKEKEQYVLKEFEMQVSWILKPITELAEKEKEILQGQSRFGRIGTNQTKKLKSTIAPEQAQWTLDCIPSYQNSIVHHLADINGLYDSAENAGQAIESLLSLKQQQASLIETRESIRQTQETVRQGQAIMAFTIITVLFLPLSFLSSVFGMNILDHPDGLASFKTQLSIMFPVSLVLAIISCVLAFSKVTRAFLFYVLSVSWCWIITKFPFYVAWKEIGYNSRYFKYEQKVKRAKMKEAALQRQRDKVLRRRRDEV
ncbi:hypothetical protein BGZ60DRAFT_499681 [Tricladium varicosporioides]|nr:hypothetical protein BGZ60DRAFT_499681 [Hymenoscyphus varicosporioides]